MGGCNSRYFSSELGEILTKFTVVENGIGNCGVFLTKIRREEMCVVDIFGEGGFGHGWVGLDVQNNSKVFIKTFLPEVDRKGYSPADRIRMTVLVSS